VVKISNKYYLYSLYFIALLSFITFGMEVGVDRVMFIGFGENIHSFKEWIVPSIPYYIFWLTVSASAIKKDPRYLFLSPVFFILIMQSEGHYLYMIWIKHPEYLTFMYTKILAVLSCIVVTGSFILFLIFLHVKLSNRR